MPDSFLEWNINQAIARFRPISGLEPEFLEAFLRSRLFLDWAISKSKATAGQFNLTLEICRDAPIPVPPRNEQVRITQKLASIASSESNTARTVSTSLARNARLRQSILKWAFEGKLVEQDSCDEPASALLERIKAEREAAEQDKPKRRRKKGSTT